MTDIEAKEMLQAKLTCMELDSLSCVEKGCNQNCDDCVFHYAQGTMGEQKDALAVAINALEKQTPKKIIGGTVSRDMACHCPICMEFVGFADMSKSNYCSHCGQKLTWS